MSFFGLILLFLLFWFIILPLFKVGYRIHSGYRQYKRAAEAMRGETAADAEPQRRRGGWSYPATRRHKVFSRDAGEYVKFTEISSDDTEAAEQVDYVEETQITDVEWEDLPRN